MASLSGSKKRRLSRLPMRVHLGRGYVVHVYLVSPVQIREMLDEDDAGAPQKGVGQYAAFWDDDQRSIFVDSTMNLQRQWEAYFHEMTHAIHDTAERNRGGI